MTIDDNEQLPTIETLGVGELNVKFPIGICVKAVDLRGTSSAHQFEFRAIFDRSTVSRQLSKKQFYNHERFIWNVEGHMRCRYSEALTKPKRW